MRLPKAKQLPSGEWYMQVSVDGQRYNKAFPTKEEAEYWAAGLKTKSIENSIPAREVTVRKAFADYIESRSNVLSPSTLKAYKNIQKNYFSGLMGRKASSIQRQDIQREINELSKEKSVKTIKNAVALLLSVIADYTNIDPRKLTYPQATKKEHPFLEAPDIAKLIDVIRGDKIEVPVLLALWLGLRRSEICALEWSDIDFEKKTVSITKAVIPNDENKYVLKKTTKTEKSRRVLDLPDYLISRLEALQPDLSKRVGRITTMNPNDIYNHLKVICDRNEIPFVGIHGLRHTNASVMLSVGITAKLAMARGGWSNNATMQNIYQHLFSSDKELADKKINDFFDALTPGK